MTRTIHRTYNSWKTASPDDERDDGDDRPARDPDAEYDAWRDEQMAKDERKIRTSNIRPPIPMRTFDWHAFYDGQEESGPSGFGRTEAEAIKDLIEQTEDE